MGETGMIVIFSLLLIYIFVLMIILVFKGNGISKTTIDTDNKDLEQLHYYAQQDFIKNLNHKRRDDA